MKQQAAGREDFRPDVLELAAGYAEESILVTTANLDLPGPQILYVNSAFARLMGYSQSELLGKTPRLFQGPKTDRKVLRRLREDLEAGRDFIGRTSNYRCNGEEFELEWMISHIRDDAGNTTHYIAVQRDVTDRKFAEQELQRRDAELERTSNELLRNIYELNNAQRQVIHQQRLAALGKMAAGVVHDINNALTPMWHMIELMGNSRSLSEEVRAGLHSLEFGVGHLRQLVENLHKFYYNLAEDPFERVDLRDLLKDIRELTQSKWKTEAQAVGAGIDFELNLSAVPMIQGNSVEMRQVVVNLIFNAVDAMPQGGPLELRLFPSGNQVVVEVEDAGTGLSDESLAHCFEPYYTSKAHGTGLGLSVCHGIVARHGGQIAANRSRRGGAVFRFTIPAVEASAKGKDAKLPLQILYIDVDDESRSRVVTLMRSEGHRVTPAATADEGLETFYRTRFDCVIVNLDAKSSSSINVAVAIKQAKPDFPMIALTTEHRQEVPRLFPAGLAPDAVSQRPTNSADLARMIKIAMYRS